MGSANMAYMSNQITATNADLYVRNVGFLPRKIRIVNLTNQISIEWTEGLPSANFLKIAAAGDLSVVTSGGVITSEDSSGNQGFKLPALADINDTTTEALLWECFG